MALKGLSAREQRFIDEFMKDGNATQAVVRAGYSAKTPQGAVFKLFNRPRVMREIERRQALAEARSTMTKEALVERLEWIVESNMSRYMRSNADGDPVLSFKQLTREESYALTEVTVETYTEGRGEDAQQVKRVKFKRADMLKAADLLTKLHGWEKPKKVDVNVRSMETRPTDDNQAAEAAYMSMLDGDNETG